MFAIYDKVTGEWLESYDDTNKDQWTGPQEPETLKIFDNEEEAQKAVKILEASFKKAGETKIDFSIRAVERVRLQYSKLFWEAKK